VAVWPSLAPRIAQPRATRIALPIASERAAAWTAIAGWWALSRALVVGTAFTVQLLQWPRSGWYATHDQPLALLGAWDGRWYRMVAARGYLVIPHHQSDTAFFPLLPLILRAGRAIGLPFNLTGIIVVNSCLLVALVALYELNRQWFDDRTALHCAIYAALFPLGYVFSMVYPEAIVLAAVALAGAFAARERWGAATAAAAFAGLGRPQAAFLALPLGALALRDWRRSCATRRFRATTAALAPLAAIGGLAVYDWRTFHDPFAFASAQRAWGRSTSVDGIRRATTELVESLGTSNAWLFRDAAFCVLYLVLFWIALRHGVPRSWVIAGALTVLLPLWSGSFTSDARFGLLALPVYSGLACIARRPFVDAALRGACAAGLVAATASILMRWP
jgi:hypothetical protein